MKSHTTERFRKAYENLPKDVRDRAKKAYRLFQQDPYHPSIRFKQVHPTKPIYSARIGMGYRALAVRENEDIIWFWIGAHTEYEQLLNNFG